MKSEPNINVKTLLESLQTTIDFESKLDKRFSNKDSNEDPQRGRYQRFISSSFDPYLDYYIQSEDKCVLSIKD